MIRAEDKDKGTEVQLCGSSDEVLKELAVAVLAVTQKTAEKNPQFTPEKTLEDIITYIYKACKDNLHSERDETSGEGIEQ